MATAKKNTNRKSTTKSASRSASKSSQAQQSNSVFDTKFAIITGASSGIGLELAKLFAKDGYDLLLCSNSDGIYNAREEIGTSNVQIETLEADLADPSGVEELVSYVTDMGRPIDALVLNAGVGLGGAFIDQDIDEVLNLLNLNITGTVHLAHHLIPTMAERGEGKILFTSSIGSMMPGTYEAVYSGSKAFIQSFAQALRSELKDTGVTVTSLQPGPTETNFFHRAHMDDTRIGSSKKDHPADVAYEGYQAMMKGTDSIVAGSFKNKVFTAAGKFLPETFGAAAHAKMSEPGSGSGAPPEPSRKSSMALPILGAAALGATALFLVTRSERPMRQ